MSDSDASFEPGSSQQPFQHTYNLWKSSAYYNINDLSARNLVVKETENEPCTSFCEQEEKVVRDAKNRRIISKDSLYKEPFSFWSPKEEENVPEPKIIEPPEPQPVMPNDWTSQYWQKASNESKATSEISATLPQGYQCQNHNVVKPNKIQKKLSKALSQPLKIDKAASMMAKMGWQGGALGKCGTGIVEPIAPNTNYASKTTGFGHLEPPPKPPPKPKQTRRMQKVDRRKSRKSVFRKNVLMHILDFVKNDYEIEIMFEIKLTNEERKMIHDIVEEIMNVDVILAMKADIEDPDIFYEIVKFNRYILRTQSEGVKPNRSLCIYKEAPECLYLVTHCDLRYDPEETDDTNEKTDIEMDTDANEHLTEVKKENQNENDVSIEEESDEIINVSDVDDPVLENDNINEIVNNDDDSKSVTKSNESLDEDLDEYKSMEDGKECQIVIHENKDSYQYVKSYYLSKSGVLKYKMRKMKIDPVTTNVNNSYKKTSKFRKVTTNTLDKEKNPFLKSILSVQTANNEPLTKTDLKNQIMEYFDEFAKIEFYTEFKFLGPFESIEVETINEFIHNLWLCLNDGDYLNDEILCVIKDAKCGFAIKMDPNGSALIYKTKREESDT